MEKYVTFFPQFQSDPVNDKAWYPGFSDWDLIGKLPRNFVDRFTPSTGFYTPGSDQYMSSLGEKLKLSGVDGLAIYHYYFNGQHVLPSVEKWILNSKPDFNFFFIWANETWTKRWIGKPHEIIIRQKHEADEAIIEKHAAYIATFMKMPNYRTIDGRPLFILYNPSAVADLGNVINIYRKKFTALGLDPLIGVCVAHMLDSESVASYDFICEFQPRLFFNFNRYGKKRQLLGMRAKAIIGDNFEIFSGMIDKVRRFWPKTRKFYYDEYIKPQMQTLIADYLITVAGSRPIMRCLFVSWNNMPRYGKSYTEVVPPSESCYAIDQIKKINSSEDYPLLINSWNEWSEGAALEEAVEKIQFTEMIKQWLCHG
jgi:hypothetical protein